MVNERLDLTKPVQTKDGRPVRILCTDREGTDWPVVGLVTCGDEEYHMYWMSNGNPKWNTEDKLVNVPPPKQVLYFNMYKDGTRGAYKTRDSADKASAYLTGRIACVRVEFSEGQFDE